MQKQYDVLIIGAGVAGLYTAQALAEKKTKVCLVETKADPLNLSFFTLGSFLDIKKYGFTKKIIAAKISKVSFYSKRLSIKRKGHAYILDKKELHRQLLFKCKKNNVELKFGTTILNTKKNSHGFLNSIIDEKGNRYKAKIFVDCSGKNGVLTKKFKLFNHKVNLAQGIECNCRYKENKKEVHFFYGKSFKGGYGWIFPLKGRRAIVGYGSFDQKIKTSLTNHFNKMLEEPLIKKLIEKDNEKIFGGSFPINEIKTHFVNKNVVGIGDSVSQGNPLFGEGYRFIIDSSSIASKFILDCIKTNNLSFLKGYEKNGI